jgi:hypothetical protein
MIKFLSSLIIVSAALGISDPSSAQEAFGGHMGHIPSALHANMGLDSPFIRSFPSFSLDSSSGLGSHFSSSSGLGTSPSVPRVLLPLPINGPLWGSQSRYGFQYPGSYLPAGTPLHRYNGYIVCNPPAAAAGKRTVKITTTRSLAAPGDTQPCPVYTIDGEVPKTKNYTTTSVPSTTRNPPP